MMFQFMCVNCGTLFERDVPEEAVEVFLDAFEAGGKETMKGCCHGCLIELNKEMPSVSAKCI